MSSPDSVFPHGTGAVVDVSLFERGAPIPMGTDFDEFTDKSAPNWYRANPPVLPQDIAAHLNRKILRRAMESGGFIGFATEWWHFEWGTQYWASVTHERPRLTTTL